MSVTLHRAVAHERVLQNAPATLRWVFQDQYGEPVAEAGPVDVTVKKADGTALTTGSATAGDEVDEWTFAITATQTADLQLLEVTWDAGSRISTSLVRVVGAYHVSLTDARSIDPSLVGGIYDDDLLIWARFLAEEELTRQARCDFVPSFHRIYARGSGTPSLVLPDPYLRRVVTAQATGYLGYSGNWSYSSTVLQSVPANDIGVARLTDGSYWEAGEVPNILVEYEAGLDRCPGDMQIATVMLMRYRINQLRNGRFSSAQPIQGPNGETVQPASFFAAAMSIARSNRMVQGVA